MNGFVSLDGDYFDEDSDRGALLKTEQEPPQNFNMDDNVTADVSDEQLPWLYRSSRMQKANYQRSIHSAACFNRRSYVSGLFFGGRR